MTDQVEYSNYRVIVFGREGTDLVLSRSQFGLRFPQAMVPRWERVAENVGTALKMQWGQEVFCLFELRSPLVCGNYEYVVARHWRATGMSAAPLYWTRVDGVTEDSLADASDYSALQESIVRCESSLPGLEGKPCTDLNWFEELCEWIKQEIKPRGVYLTGNFRQLNAGPLFSLIRFETNGPGIWFKAVGAPHEREFLITQKLAQFFPNHITEIVAARADWNAWLMWEAAGTQLGESAHLSVWKRSAAALATLQIESIAHIGELIDAGAHDRKPRALADLVSPFIADMGELMSQQSKVPPAILSLKQLKLLEEQIRDAALHLDVFGIPATLGHLDLNPGNIVVSPTACCFLDWAEACVGHPFCTFQYLLEHSRRVIGTTSADEEAVVASYLTQWDEIASWRILIEALALAPLLAVFAYAIGIWASAQTGRQSDPNRGGYLRALTRRMWREAEQLSGRRAVCPS